jgi:hypothetical protein
VVATYTTTASGGTWSKSLTAAQAQGIADGTYTVKADVGGAEATQSLKVQETPPSLSSVSFTVWQGGAVVLAAADFSITDPYSTDFTYTVSNLAGGKFQVWDGTNWVDATSFTSADVSSSDVRFLQDGTGTAPSFSIAASDGVNGSSTIAGTATLTNTANLSDSNGSVSITAVNDTVNVSGSSEVVGITGNNNTVNVSGAHDTVTVSGNGETVNVSGAIDSVTLNGAGDTLNLLTSDINTSLALTASGAIINLLGGGDSVTITGDGDHVNVTGASDVVTFTGNNEVVTLGSGQEKLTFNGSNETVTLGSGPDSITFNSGPNTVTAAITSVNAADHLSGSGNDTLNLTGAGSLNFKNIIFSGFSTINLDPNNPETVTLNNDAQTLNPSVPSLTINGSSNDTVTLGPGKTSVSFVSGSNVVNATLGTGATLIAGDSLLGGGGTDKLVLTGTNTTAFDLNSLAAVTGFEIISLAASENVILTHANLTVAGTSSDTVTLGAGTDSVTFASGANTVNAVLGTGATLHSGDTLIGGSGTDTLSLTGANTTAFNLNSITLTGFETVKLGVNENVTLNNASLSVQGAGSDVVTLGTGTDTVSFVSGTNTVNASLGVNGTLHSGDGLTGGSGSDTLNLSGTGNFDFTKITFAGFETLNLLNVNETITLNNSNITVNAFGNDTVTLGTGNDSVAFGGGTNTVNAVLGKSATLHPGDSLIGGTGTDSLVLSGKGSLDLTQFTFSGFENIKMGTGEKLTLNGSSLSINAAAGSDTVAFHSNFSSAYTINGFVATGSTHDTIDLDKSLLGTGTSNQWLSNTTNIYQSGSNVVIHDGSNTITVLNAKLSDIQHDLLFT